MKKVFLSILFAAMAFVALGALGGCATVIGVASDAGLKAMKESDRAKYRDGLDEVGDAIDLAKSKYDSQYNRDGTPIEPVAPAPTVEPEPGE